MDRTMDREARLTQLQRALAEGAFHLVDRLLGDDPGLAEADFCVQVAMYQRAAVLRRLAAEPALAVRPLGKRRPILHLAFSRWPQRYPERRPDGPAIAEALVACGADVNDGFRPDPDSDHALSALYGALGHAGNLSLARWLLEQGADPDDGESLYHATELPDLEGVRLLMAHGVNARGTNAFYRMLDFDNLEGARLFLDYGADPNEPLLQDAEDGTGKRGLGNTLHHAIRRGRDGRFADLLLAFGVDPAMTCFGHTPYALARVLGNESMAEVLRRHGLETPLRPDEVFLAAVSEGDEETARRLYGADPDIVRRLHPHDQRLPIDFAPRPERLKTLRLMAAVGFDFDLTDDSGLCALHAAAWAGQAEAVQFLLDLGPDLERRNGYGGTALGTAIHGSANCPHAARGDYPRTVALLREAGARLRPEQGHLEMGTPEVLAVLEAGNAN